MLGHTLSQRPHEVFLFCFSIFRQQNQPAGGRGRGGRGGKSRGGGMQGVGIGASPAYPRGGGSARTGGGDGEGSGAAAAAKPSALVAERTLLKEVVRFVFIFYYLA